MSFGEGNLRTAVAELQGENKALRQLALDMWLTWKCLDMEGDWPMGGHNGWRTFEQRMMALGIEVDR